MQSESSARFVQNPQATRMDPNDRAPSELAVRSAGLIDSTTIASGPSKQAKSANESNSSSSSETPGTNRYNQGASITPDFIAMMGRAIMSVVVPITVTLLLVTIFIRMVCNNSEECNNGYQVCAPMTT